MWTEFHTTAAVDADKGFAGWVKVDGVDRARMGAGPATNAQLLLDHHAAPFSRRIGPCRASHSAGRRIACQAGLGLEAGGKTARRVDPYSRLVPGKLLVHQTGAGQRTGVTTNASFHARRAQNLHQAPIWFTLMRMELATPSRIPWKSLSVLVTARSSPTSWTVFQMDG